MTDRIRDRQDRVRSEQHRKERILKQVHTEKKVQFEQTIATKKQSHIQKEKITEKEKSLPFLKEAPKSQKEQKLPFLNTKPPSKDQQTSLDKAKPDQEMAQQKEVLAEEQRQELATEEAVRQKNQNQKDSDSSKDPEQFFQQAVLFASQVQTAESTQKTTPTQAIPKQILDEIVRQIQVATLPTGKTQVQIELKGYFAGTTISIAGENGKIQLRFSGLSKEGKALLKGNQQALVQRLENQLIQVESIELE